LNGDGRLDWPSRTELRTTCRCSSVAVTAASSRTPTTARSSLRASGSRLALAASRRPRQHRRPSRQARSLSQLHCHASELPVIARADGPQNRHSGLVAERLLAPLCCGATRRSACRRRRSLQKCPHWEVSRASATGGVGSYRRSPLGAERDARLRADPQHLRRPRGSGRRGGAASRPGRSRAAATGVDRSREHAARQSTDMAPSGGRFSLGGAGGRRVGRRGLARFAPNRQGRPCSAPTHAGAQGDPTDASAPIRARPCALGQPRVPPTLTASRPPTRGTGRRRV
jgi:hypothetical protein